MYLKTRVYLPVAGALMALLAAGAGVAQEAPQATKLGWRELWKGDGAVRLAIAEQATEQKFDLPPLKAEQGQVLCLRFQSRLDWPSFSGWNNYLAVALNGTPLGPKTPQGGPRLLNRRLVVRTSNPSYPSDNMIAVRDNAPCVLVFFGPANTALEATILTERDEGYWYVLDIGDAARSDARNQLTLGNKALARYFSGNLPPNGALVVESLSVGLAPEGEIAALRDTQLAKRAELPGVDLPGEGAMVRVPAGGGMELAVGGERYFVESSLSFPRDGGGTYDVPLKRTQGSHGMGHNEFACQPEASGEPGWRPEVAAGAGGLTLKAEAATYGVERRIVRNGPRIEIADTITNKTDQVLGVAVSHRIMTPALPKRCLVNGLENAGNGAGSNPENPTAFIAQAASGLGAVAEDNALRLQHWTQDEENSAAFGTDRLGLAPGETYAVRWVLYPGSGDYFDFINQVRRDWRVNFTVDGPWDFFDVRRLSNDEGRNAARALLARRRTKLFALVPWFEYYNGWPYSRDAFKKLMGEAMAFLKGVVPDAKFLACTETNLVPVDLSFFGDTIPKEGWPIGRDVGGKYGQIAAPEMTARVNASPWRDSCQRDGRGDLLLDCWYVQHYKDRPALNLMVYPELCPAGTSATRLSPYAEGKTPFANHRHQQMLEQLTWLLGDSASGGVGFDGVYIDQFSLAFNTGDVRWTKERWDGRTVILDSNGRVAEKLADTGLISAEARREWVEFALKRGKVVVCNTLPAVNELQGLAAFRFMETQGYEPLAGDGPPYQATLAKGQLGSPIGLGHSFPSNAGADFFMRTVIAHLRFGMLYYYYSCEFPADGDRGGEFGPVNHMFPFTPIELHEGWVLGQERLITCISGEFPWPQTREPRVLQFDSRGRERPADAEVRREGNGCRVRIKLRDWWEIAVVE